MIDFQATQLIQTITEDMHQALSDKNDIALSQLRSLLSRISNAEAVNLTQDSSQNSSSIAGATSGLGSTEAPRKNLTAVDIQAIIQDELAELTTVVAPLDPNIPYAIQLQQRIAIMQKYTNLLMK